jgi:hypothetical protein
MGSFGAMAALFCLFVSVKTGPTALACFWGKLQVCDRGASQFPSRAMGPGVIDLAHSCPGTLLGRHLDFRPALVLLPTRLTTACTQRCPRPMHSLSMRLVHWQVPHGCTASAAHTQYCPQRLLVPCTYQCNAAACGCWCCKACRVPCLLAACAPPQARLSNSFGSSDNDCTVF